MYKGKHEKKRNRKSGKFAALLVSLVLITGVTVSGTLAFLIAETGNVTNTFTPSQVTTEVVEDIESDPTIKSDVYIKNTGDTEAWIRAAVVVTWQDGKGNVYGKAPVKGADYTKWDPGTNWITGADGFYYYTKPVAAGATTPNALIPEISLIGNLPADGYFLNVEIIGSGIQSKPADAFDTAWASSGLKVDDKDSDPMEWTLVNK